MSIDDLSFDIFKYIIENSIETYRNLLAIPTFVRMLTTGNIFDFMVKFGYDVHIEYYSGSGCYNGWCTVWYLNKRKHRVNGPAVEFADGSEEWYYKGLLHNNNGPAINRLWGFYCGDAYCGYYYKAFYKHGLLHNKNGPAIIRPDKQIWCINNQRHNENGPAVIRGDHKKWYLYDRWYRSEKNGVTYVTQLQY
jgi:hypothetical protein